MRAEWALLADPQYRWGGLGDTDNDLAWRDSRVRSLVESVLKYDRADWPDDELLGFVDNVGTLESRYRTMIHYLREQGTRVVLHGTGPAGEAEFLSAFENVGLRIYGPGGGSTSRCYRRPAVAIFDKLRPSADRSSRRAVRAGAGSRNARQEAGGRSPEHHEPPKRILC